jgi:glutathione S-transferase
MALEIYAHPFSSYCQKVLIALYENETLFDYKMLGPDAPENFAEFTARWPMQKFPLLVDDGTSVIESSIIIEHLALFHKGPVALLPQRAETALKVRFMDRFFDNYIMTPMQRIVADFMREPGARDAKTVADANALLDHAYGWLNGQMTHNGWAVGDEFTMADCAAAPSLFYADWVRPIPEHLAHTSAYRSRLLARPSVKRAVDEARPYRHFFPPGAPDRD